MISIFKKKDEFTKELEKFLGFRVHNISFYQEALTHPSKKLSYNYQRLEFLGDAVLNLLVAEYVFKHYHKLAEGELSKLRTKLVNKQILKEVAIKLNIPRLISHRLSDSELQKSYIYSDIIEALIGAIYLDKGIKYAQKFIDEKIIQQLDEVIHIEDTDYKSKIIQIAQKNKWSIRYQLESTEKENNDTIFKVSLLLNRKKIAEAKHYNKKQAQQIASRLALEKLNHSTQ